MWIVWVVGCSVAVPDVAAPPVEAAPRRPEAIAESVRLVSAGPDAFGEERTFYVHLPGNRVPESPLPAVFVFHGGKGSNGKVLMPYWRQMFDKDLILVFPNGQLRDTQVGGWDDEWEKPWFQVEVAQRVVQKVVQEFNADPEHLYGVGFSSGGHLINQVACHTPTLFRGFGRTGRTLRRQIREVCATPTDRPQMMVLGTSDDSAKEGGKLDPRTGLVQELPSEEAWAFWLAAAGCSPDQAVEAPLPDRGESCEVVERTWRGCGKASGMRYLRVIGGEHEWFSAEAERGSCHELDNTRAFLSFFEEFAGLPRSGVRPR